VIAQEDPEMMDWLYGGMFRGGGFVQSICAAGLRADSENYDLLRPSLLKFKEKYPQYVEIGQSLAKPDRPPGERKL